MRSRAVAVLGALALSTVAVVATAAPASAATVDGKVSFCHATGSAKNPYLTLKVSSSATNAWSYTNGTHKNDLGTVGAAAAGNTPTISDTSGLPTYCIPNGDATTTPSNGTGGSAGTTDANPSTSIVGTTDGGTTTTPTGTTGGTTGGTTAVTDGTAGPSAGIGGTVCTVVYVDPTTSTSTCANVAQ
ncbi:hypothetical protein QDR37_12700 [Amnibacterium sp. CER49]|uniref:hypothetical protein n=1 Tax=Amnibacterium sp. CER49 TaxID=3039161 RepID=UPI00244759B1|nr:hypothetical protein [Amnibacterium sp. CER49]MDH2444807.1 hypothetical protein [Amnibacterium sp. CER49]